MSTHSAIDQRLALAKECRSGPLFVLRIAQLGWLPPTVLILVGLLLNAAHIGVAVCSAMVFYKFLDGQSLHQTQLWLVALVIALVLRPLIQLARDALANTLAGRLKNTLRTQLWDLLADRGPMRLHGVGHGRFSANATDGVEAMEPYFARYLPHLVITAVTSTAVCVGIAQLSLPIAVTLATCAAVTLATPRLWDKALAEKGQAHWSAYEHLNTRFLDAMVGMTTLKSFNAGTKRRRELDHMATDLLQKTLAQLRLGLGETGVSAFVALLGPALALILGAHAVWSGQLPSWALLVIVLSAREAIRPVQELASNWHAGMFGLSASQELLRIYQTLAANRPKRAQHEAKQTLAPLAETDYVAEFLDLNYTYVGNSEPALSQVTGKIHAGQSTAIVGGSGSGKSTLIGLLCQLDQPTSGTIHRGPGQIALVAQDAVVFAGTVRDGLRQTNPTATDEDLHAALQIAQWDVPAPDGSTDILATTLEERGTNISGGQRQRYAIARALVANPDVLILDEATSALDSATETAVLNSIAETHPKLSVVAVTHRLDVASRCAEVLVFSGGRLVQTGNPQTLSRTPGPFADLCADAGLTPTQS